MAKRVLVVEDDPALRAVVRFSLQRAGFDVVAGANGSEGWRHLQKEAIDMVVSDQQMPLITGLELCGMMREDPRFALLPVVLLTGKGFELDAEQLRRDLGVSKLMSKPFSPRELVAVVGGCLQNAVTEQRRAEAVAAPCSASA
jgi:CheY-like chemotaxis protein